MPPNTEIPPIPVAPLSPAPVYPPPEPHNSSGIAVGIVIGLMIAVIAGGAYFFLSRGQVQISDQPVVTTNTTSAASSCAEGDMNCLLVAAGTCSPAKVTNVSEGISTSYEIVGSDSSGCHFRQTYLGGTVVFDKALIDKGMKEGATTADINSLQNLLQKSSDANKDKTATCVAPTSEVSAYLTSLLQSIRNFEQNGNATADTDSKVGKFINNSCITS